MTRFILLYAVLYAAYGVASPFFPELLASRGLSPAELGLVLGCATTIRLVASPLAGRVGDALGSLRVVLVACLALATVAALGFLPARGFWIVLGVALLHAAALSPGSVLSDALSLGAAAGKSGVPRFEYGRVRGTGSGAFVAGTLVSGQVVAAASLAVIIPMQSALLALATLAALRVPELDHRRDVPAAHVTADAVKSLLRIPAFRNVVIAAALILGSHALHDAFAVIRWSAAGIGSRTESLLWSEAVIAEVLVFFLLGPQLVVRLTPAGAIALAALAGLLRWSVMASTSSVLALALIQPLHGLTFALLHLACMRVLARVVPHGLEGTAQSIYATVGAGGASALVTLLSGTLYARFGAQAFWAMALLSGLGLGAAWRLGRRS